MTTLTKAQQLAALDAVLIVLDYPHSKQPIKQDIQNVAEALREELAAQEDIVAAYDRWKDEDCSPEEAYRRFQQYAATYRALLPEQAEAEGFGKLSDALLARPQNPAPSGPLRRQQVSKYLDYQNRNWVAAAESAQKDLEGPGK